MTIPRASGKLQLAQRNQQIDADRVGSVTDRIIRLYGLIDVNDTGEALVDISFAALFIEVPSYSRGWQLAEGQVVAAGSYPTMDMGVHSFTYDTSSNGLRYYTGAKMIFVVTGIPDQRLIAHYQFEGRAIVPPVVLDVRAEDTV